MLRRIRHLWQNLIHPRRLEQAIDDEVRGAFDSLVETLTREGVDPAEARREATRRFGRVDTVVAQVREARAGAFFDPLRQDVRYGGRLLLRSPLFTLFAVASLALGIGATSAIFSLFDRIVLRTLPVSQPERLVVASFGRPGSSFNYNLPYPQFAQMAARTTTLSSVFAMSPFGRVTVGVEQDTDIAEGLYVSGDYYRGLELSPAVGRLLQPADDRSGDTVAVLSHAYWQRRFAGRADIVGTAVTLNQIPFTIVGVEPAAFHGVELGRPYDISLAIGARRARGGGMAILDDAFATWIYVMGRLKPGATLAQAQQELAPLFTQVGLDAARTPGDTRLAREYHLRLEPGAHGVASGLRRTYGPSLQLLLGALAAVLLLASLNVATLLLSRADARQREIATRLALGAGRIRIIRQLLTESLLLATLAGACGLALASWGSRVLLTLALPGSDRLPIDLTPNLRLALFTIAVSVVTCLLFGLLPAIRGTSPARVLATRQVGGGQRRRRLDRVLVAAQIAVSLVLLVGAALFVRTLEQLWAQDAGYDRRNVLMFSVDAQLAGRKGADVPLAYRQILDALRIVPGAQSVTVSAVRPVSSNYYFIDSVSQIGDRVLADDQRIRVAFNRVAPAYFSTFSIPLVAGRDFDDRDSPTSPLVVIISERMTRHFTGSPIGQRIGSGPGAREVVGVARDTRYANVKDAPRDVLYYPLFQGAPREFGYSPSFEVRYSGSASELIPAIRAAVTRVDGGLQLFAVRTLEAETANSLSRERLLAVLTSYFGAFAVILAAIGLYGVMSYGVTLRAREIGLRMALGAQPRSVCWLVVREATVTVVAGVVVGVIGAFGTVRFVRSQLFGVEPHDPIALACAIGVLVLMAGVAAYVPARRASRIDPATALRGPA